MEMTFSIKSDYKGNTGEYAIRIRRLTADSCLLEYLINDIMVHEGHFTLKELQERLKNYNTVSRNGIAREGFDSIHPEGSSWIELSRIIGITNYLAHYFMTWDSEAFAEQNILDCFINTIKGFTFIDWSRIAEADDDMVADADDQLLYISSNGIDEKYPDQLEELYEKGTVAKIHLKVYDRSLTSYCATSRNLNRNVHLAYDAIVEMIKEINQQLRRKYGK